MKKLFFKAEKTENERLDVFLAGAAEGLSRAHALKLIEAGNVKINGATELKGKRQVKAGDEIVLDLPEPQPVELKAENISLDIVYQDEWLAVINKQQGLTVHPANNVYTGTLVNALLEGFKRNKRRFASRDSAQARQGYVGTYGCRKKRRSPYGAVETDSRKGVQADILGDFGGNSQRRFGARRKACGTQLKGQKAYGGARRRKERGYAF